MRRLWQGVLFFVALLPAGRARAVLEAGAVAPPLEGPNAQGKAIRVAAQPGRALLLVFARPGDKHTSAALAETRQMLAHTPELAGRTDPVVVLRGATGEPPPAALRALDAPWRVLLDARGQSFEGYGIVVSPSVVIVGGDGHVTLAHPGYDPSLAQKVRLGLAQTLSMKLGASARGEKAPAPDLELQLARRLASRRLWDEALRTYGKAAQRAPLAPADQLQLARIQVELGQTTQALRTLEALPATPELAAPAAELRARAAQRHTPAGPPRKAPAPH